MVYQSVKDKKPVHYKLERTLVNFICPYKTTN